MLKGKSEVDGKFGKAFLTAAAKWDFISKDNGGFYDSTKH